MKLPGSRYTICIARTRVSKHGVDGMHVFQRACPVRSTCCTTAWVHGRVPTGALMCTFAGCPVRGSLSWNLSLHPSIPGLGSKRQHDLFLARRPPKRTHSNQASDFLIATGLVSFDSETGPAQHGIPLPASPSARIPRRALVVRTTMYHL